MSKKLGTEVSEHEAKTLMSLTVAVVMMTDGQIVLRKGSSPFEISSEPIWSAPGTDPCLVRGDDGTLVMFHGGGSGVVYRTSRDGAAWSSPESVVWDVSGARYGERVSYYPMVVKLNND